jgi:hypothetical protein
MDHSTGAIPTIRIANQEAAIKQVDEVAALVGTEKFFLKVGEMLYNKGADIGLRPDGIVSDTGAERISAGTTLSERVDEMHHRSETVINPSIGELVAMAGQIDELKRIRAMVKEAAIAQNLKPADIDKLDKDAKEFLEQPEVKDSIDKLEKAEAELSDVTVQLAKLDADGNGVSPSTIGENVSPSRIEGNIPASTEGAMSNHAATESGTQAVLSPEYIALEANRNSLVHDVLKHITTLRQYSEKFAADHPNWAKAGSWALQGIGYVGAGALVKTGLKLGGKKMLALFGAHVLSQEVIASVIEHGTDALVDHAISYASTDQEAAEFAKTAVWTVEMLLDGTAIIGVAGLIKDKAAITNKLRANKVNVAATAKAKFAKKQHLRAETSRKISAVVEEKVAAWSNQSASSFRVIREISKDSTNSGVFHREVEFTYRKTGQTFKVTQRRDIDPNYVVKNGQDAGLRNIELLKMGRAPYTSTDEQVILHHIGQNAKGPLVEVIKATHKPLLHKQYGTNESHPTNPVVREEFDPIRREYWKTYGEAFK